MTNVYQAKDGLWHIQVSDGDSQVELMTHYFTRDAAVSAAQTVPCHLVLAQLLAGK